MFNIEWHIMRQLVKRTVKYSAFLGSHFLGNNVSKASVDVIRIVVSTEYVGTAANEREEIIR